jgi:hypothetical protein
MLELQRGTSVNLYANFLTLENKEAVSIVDPKVTIRHVDSGGVVVLDINEQPLTQAIETLYYYKWTIPLSADLGVYTVEYEAIIDGEYAEANESYQVGEFEGDEICDAPLTTTEKVAQYFGVDESNIQEDWIEWVTKYIETYTCQKFCAVTVTEKHDIERKREETIILDHHPLIEINQVKDSGNIINLDNFLIYEEEAMIAVDVESTLPDAIPYFTKGRQKVHVTYRYGYSSVPKDIEWAATVLAANIASNSLSSTGVISGGAVIEEEIGEYRLKRSTDTTTNTDFSSTVEGSKTVNDRLEEDVFSAKNVLRMYRTRKMRAV